MRIKLGKLYSYLMTFNIIGLFLVIYLYMKDKNQYHNKEKDDEEEYQVYLDFIGD